MCVCVWFVVVQPNVMDDHGRTALHYACVASRLSIVSRLLAEPLLHSVRHTDSYGFTPLMYAAMTRPSTDVVRAMIADGYQGL